MIDKVLRAEDVKKMVESAGWQRWILPWIEDQIERNRDIRRVSGETNEQILENFQKRKVRINTLLSFRNLANVWIEEKNKTKEDSNAN